MEIVGRGFSEAVLEALRARPEVAGVELVNGRLAVELRAQQETAPIIAELVSAGVEVEEVRKGSATLEDVFLTLVNEEAEA
jgi:ABC-2 type transport system ATP-binding protein